MYFISSFVFKVLGWSDFCFGGVGELDLQVSSFVICFGGVGELACILSVL